jgi:hypothetical protein
MWVSAKDRLPATGRLVILYDRMTVLFGRVSSFYNNGEPVFFIESGGGGWTTKVTHWQELPAPPEAYTTDGKNIYYKGTPMTPKYIAALLNSVEEAINEL